MSKSEILSLSVLESLSVGTKSLVNSNIKYPKEISKLLFFSKPNIESVAKKMNYIVKTKDVSVNNRKIVQNKFKNSYNIETSESKYKKVSTKIKFN